MKTDRELHFRDNGASKRLTIALTAVSAILVGLIVGYLMLEGLRSFVLETQGFFEPRAQIVFDAPKDAPITESDLRQYESVRIKNEMPIYLQTNSAWSETPYGDSTIGVSGCGLTVAAMTVEKFIGEVCTPESLAGHVGDSCLVVSDDGTLVNDMGKFGEFCKQTYKFGVSDCYWDVEAALNAVEGGSNVVWAGVAGYLSDRYYEGHVVALYRATDTHVWIRDPADLDNSTKPFPRDYVLNNVDWQYFYTVEGGE